MRLVNADAVLENIKAQYSVSKARAIRIIESAPTVDAVPVVRCKDCKFYHRMTAETGICVLACRHLGNDGFCSEGERKDGEQT